MTFDLIIMNSRFSFTTGAYDGYFLSCTTYRYLHLFSFIPWYMVQGIMWGVWLQNGKCQSIRYKEVSRLRYHRQH